MNFRSVSITSMLFLITIQGQCQKLKIEVPIMEGTPLCENVACKYYTDINVPPKPSVDINMTELDATVHSLETHYVPFYLFEVSVMKRKCDYVPGGNNTDCEEWKFFTYTIDVAEANLMAKEKKCRVGARCRKGSDCYGGGASHCDNPKRDRLVIASDPEYDTPPAPWENIFSKTCEMFWKCVITVREFPIQSTQNAGRVTYFIKVGDNTEEIPIHESRVVRIGNQFLYLTPMKESMYKIKMSCLSHKNEKICASLDEHGNIKKNEIFSLDKECMSHSPGAFIYVDCKNFPQEKSHDDLYQEYFNQLSKAANMDSLIKIVIMILYQNLQSNYNTMILGGEIQKTQDLLIKSIKSSSMVNDFFMGNLLGSGGRTTWVNGKSFRFCPCAALNDSKTNCDGKSSFQGGVWRTKSKDDICIHTEESKWAINNMTLLSRSENLSLVYLDAPDLHTAAEEGRLNPNRIIMPTEPNQPKEDSSAQWWNITFLAIVSSIVNFLRDWSWIPAYFSFAFIVKNLRFGPASTVI